MKKVYNLLFVINILLGMFLFINYFFIYKYSNLSIIFAIILSIIYLICSLVYNKKKNKKIETIDLFFMSVSILLIMFLFVVSVVFQIMFNEVYSLLYFNIFVLIAHVFIIVYNLLR
jgi:hypothetical protein